VGYETMSRTRLARTARQAAFAVALVGALAAGIGACSGGGATSSRIVAGGDPSLGHQFIERYGCGSCHMIPGVRGANGLVGPPLIHWSRRSFIAGLLPNTPDNLVQWITDPQAVQPGTDMPNLHVSSAEARNIAAYLEGIR